MDREEPGANPPSHANVDAEAAIKQQRREAGINRLHERLSERALKRVHHSREATLKEMPPNETGREALLKHFDNESDDLVILMRSIAEEQYRAQEQAEIDPISGLLRGDAFRQMYELSLEQQGAREQEGCRSVLVAFDLDKFKDINETIGHAEADKILKQIGEAIQGTTRAYDFASRIGGDEFVILLNRVEKDADILSLIERVALKISKITWQTREDAEPTGITFSVGYTVIPAEDKRFFETTRTEADEIAGYSKKLGRNRVTVVDGGKYGAYKLGADGYKKANTGDVAELKTDTIESCLKEIKSNLQRIVEEIERNFDKELPAVILHRFKKETIDELTLNQLAELLLETRKRKKSGNT